MRFRPRGYCGPLVGSSCHGDTQKRVRKCAPDSNFKRKSVCHSRRTRRRSWYGGLSSTRLLEYMPSGPGKRFATARGPSSHFLSPLGCCSTVAPPAVRKRPPLKQNSSQMLVRVAFNHAIVGGHAPQPGDENRAYTAPWLTFFVPAGLLAPLLVGRIQGAAPSAEFCCPQPGSSCHSVTRVRVRKCTPKNNVIQRSGCRSRQTRRRC